jgi:hypothetical protein
MAENDLLGLGPGHQLHGSEADLHAFAGHRRAVEQDPPGVLAGLPAVEIGGDPGGGRIRRVGVVPACASQEGAPYRAP